jgi:hypothetical protein
MAMHREIKNSYRILVRNTWPYFKNTTEWVLAYLDKF